MNPQIWKPTLAQLRAARHKTVKDLIAPGLDVLFCGVNPGLYTAAIGRHFGRPGNRFWPALRDSGFTPRLFSPFESSRLLGLRLGITNICYRATSTAAELTKRELVAGGQGVIAKVKRYRPRFLAVLGVAAYRDAFGKKQAGMGRQAGTIGATSIWVLPNPSGINAHYQPKDLARLFGELRHAVLQTK